MVIEELCNVGNLNRSGGRVAVGYVMGSKRLKLSLLEGREGFRLPNQISLSFSPRNLILRSKREFVVKQITYPKKGG